MLTTFPFPVHINMPASGTRVLSERVQPVIEFIWSQHLMKTYSASVHAFR